ncbi:hypothetical protein RDABS01_014873 [Bienertia sinuspersici]
MAKTRWQKSISTANQDGETADSTNSTGPPVLQQSVHKVAQQTKEFTPVQAGKKPQGDQEPFASSFPALNSFPNINRVKSEQGVWLEDMGSITQAFVQFYSNLLRANDGCRANVSSEIVSQGPILTEHHRHLLRCDFTEKEIKQATFAIPSNKAPRWDGYNSHFFKSSWSIVGEDVVYAVRDFSSTSKLLREVSVTTLTLAPKTQAPRTLGEYRPIACCSTIYKCIFKLICHRLSLILLDIISHTQGAFVSGRSIMHNALICQDMMRFYRPSQIQDCCMFKLDVKKAYDTVSWVFMEEMMKALGFPDQFVKLIMVCITSPLYSLIINCIPSEPIKPNRGLRQGDPLITSPIHSLHGVFFQSNEEGGSTSWV